MSMWWRTITQNLPNNSEDYVHRIGRTARAGRAGRAISFATFNQAIDVQNIENLTRTELSVSPLPEDFTPPLVIPAPGKNTGKNQGFGGRRSRSGTRLGTRGRKRARTL